MLNLRREPRARPRQALCVTASAAALAAIWALGLGLPGPAHAAPSSGPDSGPDAIPDATPGAAQDADETGEAHQGAGAGVHVGDDGVTSYDATFFERFNPINAWDMVGRLPGFSVDVGDDRRGFGGNAGNVLIDGERPSTKNGIGNVLGRISASSVERIDVIRGNAAGLDVRGQSVIANVIRKEGEGNEELTWTAVARHHGGGRMSGYAELIVPFTRAALSGTLNLEINSWTPRQRREETLRDGAGALLEDRVVEDQRYFREAQPSLEATLNPGGNWVANLNARIWGWKWNADGERPVRDAAGDILRVDTSAQSERNAGGFEVGGDWERTFANDASLKLIGLTEGVGWTYAQDFTTLSANGDISRTALTSTVDQLEQIVRAVVSKPLGSHTLEFGGELVANSRETALDIEVEDAAGRRPLNVPVANTLVEETRGEVFINDVWEVSKRLSLDAGFTFEASRITQSGDASQEREFTYPKPSFAATWSRDNGDQLRASITRDVSQLDFGEFASSVQLNDDQVNLGNPDLEPEQSWQLAAEWERRFTDELVLTLEAFYDTVEEVADTVPLLTGDGPGNIGEGTRAGFRYELTAPLDALGIADATLDANGFVADSSVTDPTTGLDRSFTDYREWEFYFEFRQDLPARNMSWGWDYFQGGPVSIFRRGEEQLFEFGPGDFDVWVETTALNPITIRLGVDQTLSPERTRTRTFFVGDRASGVVDRVEVQKQTDGPLVYLRLSGNF